MQILNSWNDVIIEGEMNLQEADLRGANLQEANLREADLQEADLWGANLQEADLQVANLRGANLREAYLQEADLRGANLRRANLQEADLQVANLQEADLRGADLRGANLQEANLRGANLDYSCWPLQCTSLYAIVDDKLAAQLLFHAFAVAKINPTPEQVEFMRKFHRFDECKGINTICKSL